MPAETHVARARIQLDAVGVRVRELIIDILDLDLAPDLDGASSLGNDVALGADLGADELTRIDLVEAIEADFGERTVGFSIDDEDLADVKTVGDLIDVVVARLERFGGLT